MSAAGTITTVAGTGTFGFSGDGGPAIAAQLGGPSGVAVTADGDILVADRINNRVRAVDAGLTPPAPLSADLAIVKTDAPDPVIVGQAITYTLSVTNNGPDAATGVQATDVLPAGVTFNVVGTSASCINVSGTVTCDFGAVANAATETATIVVTANQAGSVSNTASVDGAQADPTASNDQSTATTQINAAPPSPVVNCLAAPPAGAIVGTSRADTINGTTGPDVIFGGRGGDTIKGRGGNDVICAGAGDDNVDGGDGDDRLDGANGNDMMSGGLGNDKLFGGECIDRLFGNDGDDELFGGADRDFLTGGAGNDKLDGGAGRGDDCRGNAGTDTAVGCEQTNVIP